MSEERDPWMVLKELPPLQLSRNECQEIRLKGEGGHDLVLRVIDAEGSFSMMVLDAGPDILAVTRVPWKRFAAPLTSKEAPP